MLGFESTIPDVLSTCGPDGPVACAILVQRSVPPIQIQSLGMRKAQFSQAESGFVGKNKLFYAAQLQGSSSWAKLTGLEVMAGVRLFASRPQKLLAMGFEPRAARDSKKPFRVGDGVRTQHQQ
jgi:hypothetical protein